VQTRRLDGVWACRRADSAFSRIDELVS